MERNPLSFFFSWYHLPNDWYLNNDVAHPGGGEGREYSGFQVSGMIEGFFLRLKSLIPGFFWVGKFGKYFFEWLGLSRDFLGYSKQSEDSW